MIWQLGRKNPEVDATLLGTLLPARSMLIAYGNGETVVSGTNKQFAFGVSGSVGTFPITVQKHIAPHGMRLANLRVHTLTTQNSHASDPLIVRLASDDLFVEIAVTIVHNSVAGVYVGVNEDFLLSPGNNFYLYATQNGVGRTSAQIGLIEVGVYPP